MELFNVWGKQFAQRESSVFFGVLAIAAGIFVLAEVAWWIGGRRYVNTHRPSPNAPSDDSRLESFWTLVPAIVLLVLCSVRAPHKLKHTEPSVQSDSKPAKRALVSAHPRLRSVAE